MSDKCKLKKLVFSNIPAVWTGLERQSFCLELYQKFSKVRKRLPCSRKKNTSVNLKEKYGLSGSVIWPYCNFTKNNSHHLSLTIVHTLSKIHPLYFFPCLDPVFVSLSPPPPHTHTHQHSQTHTHNKHTFIPSTVGDIYSDYVGPRRSKIVVIRKLARHLSLQQPIKQPVSPTANG